MAGHGESKHSASKSPAPRINPLLFHHAENLARLTFQIDRNARTIRCIPNPRRKQSARKKYLECAMN
jgi:hypothetical protein